MALMFRLFLVVSILLLLLYTVLYQRTGNPRYKQAARQTVRISLAVMVVMILLVLLRRWL